MIGMLGIVMGFAVIILFIEYVVGRKSKSGDTITIESIESVIGFGGAKGYDHFVAFQPPTGSKAFPFGLKPKRNKIRTHYS